jgi:hypothetical protein
MSYRVELAVYDISNGLAAQMSQAILGQRIDGIWHTGVIVYGRGNKHNNLILYIFFLFFITI